jgi:hypothetical protein
MDSPSLVAAVWALAVLEVHGMHRFLLHASSAAGRRLGTGAPSPLLLPCPLLFVLALHCTLCPLFYALFSVVRILCSPFRAVPSESRAASLVACPHDASVHQHGFSRIIAKRHAYCFCVVIFCASPAPEQLPWAVLVLETRKAQHGLACHRDTIEE